MNAPRFALRVSVRTLGTKPISGLEAEPTIMVGPVRVTLKQRGLFLVLTARDFESEASAEAFISNVKVALLNLALRLDVAFNPDFKRCGISYAENPVEAARNLAKNFGLPLEGSVTPVHGLANEEGYSIFESDKNIRFAGVGQANLSTSTLWQSAESALTEGFEAPQPIKPPDAFLTTATELYLANFYETSHRARFLTLMMCLEVLAPATMRHPAVVSALSGFRKTIEDQLPANEDADVRDAFEALLREIEFKKETSIRRRVRALLLDEAPLPKDEREELAKKVVNAYDLRGTVVHTGEVDAKRLAEALNVTLEAVKLILRARLGLAARPADEASTG